MSIENDIARIAAALEKLANVTDETPAPKPAKKVSTKPKATSKPAEETATEPEATEGVPKVTEVRKTLGQVQKAFSPEKAREILKEVGGAAVMSKVPVGKYSAIIAAAKALLDD